MCLMAFGSLGVGGMKTLKQSCFLESCEFEKAEKPNEIPFYDVHFYVHWDWVKVPREKADDRR
jgi:hypothetical protein